MFLGRRKDKRIKREKGKSVIIIHCKLVSWSKLLIRWTNTAKENWKNWVMQEMYLDTKVFFQHLFVLISSRTSYQDGSKKVIRVQLLPVWIDNWPSKKSSEQKISKSFVQTRNQNRNNSVSRARFSNFTFNFRKFSKIPRRQVPVSYTHLTLPTIA